MCFVQCIINVLVCIIIGHVTGSIHSTVQIPVTSRTTAMHARGSELFKTVQELLLDRLNAGMLYFLEDG